MSNEREIVTLVELRGVAKRYGPQWALVEVDLRCGRAESIALLGPNGAGKSTLLRILAGVTRPTRGRILWGGQEVALASASWGRKRIGFVGHRSFLYTSLSVRENLMLYASLYGLANPAQRVAELLGRFGLSFVQDRAVSHLSRGLEQRAALARALLHDPELLLLDEPFTGLDVEACAALMELLREERARGVSVVLATHDFQVAEALCERVVILVGGKFEHDGPLPASVESVYQAVVAARRQALA